MGTTVKKERSYVLDFWKIIAAYLVIAVHTALAHWSGAAGGYAGMNFNGYTEAFTWSKLIPGFPPGVYTLGFYTFTTGFWLMAAFQKAKAQGAIGKGHDMEGIYRYTAKNFVTYGPLLSFGALSGFVAYIIACKPEIWFAVKLFCKDILEFLGIAGFGRTTQQDALMTTFGGAELTDFTNYTFFPPGWYLSGLIAFGVVFFALLVMSEKITVCVIAPLFYASSYMYVADMAKPAGIGSLLPDVCVRLFGPAMLGFIGWYVVDALKKIRFTKKGERILGWLSLGAFAFNFFIIITNAVGSLVQNFAIAVSVVFAIANRDWFTHSFNKVLSKIPGKAYFGDFALGAFILHWPVNYVIALCTRDFWSPVTAVWMSVLGSTIAGIIFVPFFHKVINPFQKFLTTKVFLLNNPVGNIFNKKGDA